MKQWKIVWSHMSLELYEVWIQRLFRVRSGMDSKIVLELDGIIKDSLELEWNCQRQFRIKNQFLNQEWDGFKDHFGIGME